MNRIICDICGSEYPETESRCPICNYPRQGNEKQVAATAAETVRSKVKGGRFNSKNVKKRQKERDKAVSSQKEGNPNKPLILVIVLLLIAIALVSAYIGLRFFRGSDGFNLGSLIQNAAPTTTAPAETTVPPTVPCTGLELDAAVVEFEELGEQRVLLVMPTPGNTTDALTYRSEDPAVATVSEMGVITAVGPGQTTVTITCGSVEKTCTVVCWYQEETTAPTVPAETQPPETQPTEDQTAQPEELTLNKNDVTCYRQGETFTLTPKLGDATLSRSGVTWSTSDAAIATVENGVVTAVGEGTVTITADYYGLSASCTVRCRFEENP